MQHQLVVQQAMAGYEVAERFYEIGSISGLEETHAYLSTHKVGAEPAKNLSGHPQACGAHP